MDSSPDFWKSSLWTTSLDGVHYAVLSHLGREWRVGSINNQWLEELGSRSDFPDERRIRQLADKGIWLSAVGNTERLAIMCCGLGSAWAGMGRELYANFPAAARAIDKLADLADWDVYALLQETDPAILNDIRWQIPYLFLLEYAQWRQLTSLGLKPDLICGHSIGELAALCMARIYDPACAWYLFDTRAEHMARLEGRQSRQSGMLAISASGERVNEILAQYPDLAMANANTPAQYILGGPRETLLKARKQLRQQKIPAFMLPIGLAFHNPAMRVLRDLSFRRLQALDIRAPRVPVLSCVTNTLYPVKKDSICKSITNLDENMVNWIGSVRAINEDWNIHTLVELGPQETLCGLVNENRSGNVCISACRKNHETDAMRELCARLFAAGHLSIEHIRQQQNNRPRPERQINLSAPDPLTLETIDEDGKLILGLLSKTVGRALTAKDLSLDLRYDLALRSSSFPLLLQEAETLLQRPAPLENIFQISTVGDLVRHLCGGSSTAPESSSREFGHKSAAPGLKRSIFADGKLTPAPIDPLHDGLKLPWGGLVALCIADADLLKKIWLGFLPFGLKLAVPWPLLDVCSEFESGNCELVPLNCPLDPDDGQLRQALEELDSMYGPINGVVLAPAACDLENLAMEDRLSKIADCCKAAKGILPEGAWLATLRQIPLAPALATPQLGEYYNLLGSDKNLLYANQGTQADLDFLILELLYGQGKNILWQALDQASPYCPASEIFRSVLPPFNGGGATWQSQFSSFSEPALSSHGNKFSPSPREFPSGPWLPVGILIERLLESARLSSPWLEPVGLSDLEIFSLPSILPRITRECRIDTQNRLWLFQDGMLCRMCELEMTVRKIQKNGRHVGEFLPLAHGICLLAKKPVEPVPLWSGAEIQPPDFTPGLEEFYDHMAFGGEWRILKKFSSLKMTDQLPAFAMELVLPMPRYEFSVMGSLVEGILQAALFALGLKKCDKEAESRIYTGQQFDAWRLKSIGFIRGTPKTGGGRFFGQLRLSWNDGLLARFDAQILDAEGKPLLTLNHMEFDKIAATPSA